MIVRKLVVPVWLVAALSSCATAHDTQDASSFADADAASSLIDGGVDAPPPPPDAFCPDGDGDGARAAACGGDDCDDSDPRVGPTATVCADATHVRRCVGGELHASDPCDTATPDCDARTGACAVSACGDGVVHPDEDCEPEPHVFGCTRQCQTQCSNRAGCPDPATQFCAPDSADVQGHCITVTDPTRPGGPGDPCTTSSDCWTEVCDPRSHLCTTMCVNPDDCSAWGGWCDLEDGPYPNAPDAAEPYECAFHCDSSSECSGGAVCTLLIATIDAPPSPAFAGVTAACRLPRGAGAMGAACTNGSVCADGACIPSDGCTRVCAVTDDCPAGWSCEVYDHYSLAPPTPLGFDAPRICRPVH